MNNTAITLEPISILNKTGVTLVIHAVNYQLNSTTVNVLFKILDSNNISICSGDRVISDISDWGTDDSVLINKVLTLLGLTEAQ
jgi:isopentenyl phosphate kinase